MINLPTDVLRSFVAVAEAGSLVRATDRVFLTQSALSLQIKRLEDLIQTRLFERQGRGLVLSAAGLEVLGMARRLLEVNDAIVASLSEEPLTGPVRAGLVQDFAETLLPEVLRRFAELHPRTRLHVRVGASGELAEALRRNEIDLALCLGDPRAPDALRRVRSVWIGAARLLEEEELPLALLDPPCVFRAGTLEALERAGRRFRIAVETPSLTGLRAAVQAGLGVTCRMELFARDPDLPSPPPGLLPPMPDVGYLMLRAPDATPAVSRLGDIMARAALDLDASISV